MPHRPCIRPVRGTGPALNSFLLPGVYCENGFSAARLYGIVYDVDALRQVKSSVTATVSLAPDAPAVYVTA